VTRIAGSDPELWEQILGANSNAVLEELRGVQDHLGLLIKAVEGGPDQCRSAKPAGARRCRDSEDRWQARGSANEVQRDCGRDS
jgi:prephenate dehydrogenase